MSPTPKAHKSTRPAFGSTSSAGRQTLAPSSPLTLTSSIPSGTDTVPLTGINKEDPSSPSSLFPSFFPKARNTQGQPTTTPNTAAGRPMGASGGLFGGTSREPTSFTPPKGGGIFGGPLDNTASPAKSKAAATASTNVFATPGVAATRSAGILFGKTSGGSASLFNSQSVSPSSKFTATKTATTTATATSEPSVQAVHHPPSSLNSKVVFLEAVRVPQTQLSTGSTKASVATDNSSRNSFGHSTTNQPSLFGSTAVAASTSFPPRTSLSTTTSSTALSKNTNAASAQNKQSSSSLFGSSTTTASVSSSPQSSLFSSTPYRVAPISPKATGSLFGSQKHTPSNVPAPTQTSAAGKRIIPSVSESESQKKFNAAMPAGPSLFSSSSPAASTASSNALPKISAQNASSLFSSLSTASANLFSTSSTPPNLSSTPHGNTPSFSFSPTAAQSKLDFTSRAPAQNIASLFSSLAIDSKGSTTPRTITPVSSFSSLINPTPSRPSSSSSPTPPITTPALSTLPANTFTSVELRSGLDVPAPVVPPSYDPAAESVPGFPVEVQRAFFLARSTAKDAYNAVTELATMYSTNVVLRSLKEEVYSHCTCSKTYTRTIGATGNPGEGKWPRSEYTVFFSIQVETNCIR